MKQAQLNDAISTTESDYNVATIISNSSVNSNPAVTKNPEVSAILPKSSVNSNPVVTKNPEVIAIIPNSSVNSHPVVTKNAEVNIDGNKFGFSALSSSTVMSMKDNEAVATIKSCMTVAPESIVNSNLTVVDTTKNSSVRDKMSSLITTISPSHVWCSKPNETVSISEPDSNVVQVCPTSLVNSNIAVEVCSDGDKSSCLGDKSSDLCSLFSQSTVMPDNEKEAVSTIECCDHLEAFVPKSVDNSNPMAVVTTQNITVEDKSSSLGVSFVPSVTMTSITNEIVMTSESGSVYASDIPK